MPGLSILQLQEPLVDSMVELLTANLNAAIVELNAAYADGITVEPIQQFLDYVPVPSTLDMGLPAIGVQELDTDFEDDTQESLNALHQFAVIAVVQNVDHGLLVKQLRRTMQAIAYVVQEDRLQGLVNGSGGVMRDDGGALSINFVRTVPGPLLGDVNPEHPEIPPTSYLSWVGMQFSARRVEV